MDNINAATGIRYGVIEALDAQTLCDEIMTHGINLTYKEFREDRIIEISHALASRGDDKRIIELKSAGIDFSKRFGKERKTVRDIIFKALEQMEMEVAIGGPDEPPTEFLTELATEMFDSLENVDYWEAFEDEDYSFEDEGGNRFLLGHHGIPMIWCVKTDRIVKARLCSPCYPNAGDLSTPDSEYGFECYGVPLCYYEDLNYIVKAFDRNGDEFYLPESELNPARNSEAFERIMGTARMAMQEATVKEIVVGVIQDDSDRMLQELIRMTDTPEGWRPDDLDKFNKLQPVI